MRNCLACISLLLLLLLAGSTEAQSQLPESEGSRAKYRFSMESPKFSLSGACMMMLQNDTIKGCVFNEFGVSAFNFVYARKTERMELTELMSKLDKWYIRKLLAADMLQVIKGLKKGCQSYTDTKYNITYQFVPLQDDNNMKEENDTEK